MQTIEAIQKLTVQLGRLHGIGQKTAGRLAYHILDMPENQARELAEAILEAREKVHFCPVCGAYTETDPCPICADQTRNSKVLCVVGEARDVTAMEKTRAFHGRYHVLHGLLSPMEGIGPEDLRIRELEERIGKEGTEEIILATNPDVEGEATAAFLAGLLRPRNIVCTRLAHGIPIGGNLEYTDEVTLAKALEGRRTI